MKVQKITRQILFISSFCWIMCLQAYAQGCYMIKSADGRSYRMGNDFVEGTITISNATLNDYKNKMRNNVDMGGIYYTINSSKDTPRSVVATEVKKTADECHIILFSAHDATGRTCDVDLEIHYYIKKGISGIYSYIVVNHETTYKSDSLGEFRIMWKAPYDKVNKLYVDELLNKTLFTDDYFKNGVVQDGSTTGIPEMYLDKITRKPVEYKYSYSKEYYDIKTYGYASDANKLGIWMVFGAYDYFLDGPTKQDITVGNINRDYGNGPTTEADLHCYFSQNHFGGSQIAMRNGVKFKKIYGPVLLYMNNLGGDASWADAKSMSDKEVKEYPSVSVTDVNPDVCPPRNQRKDLTGKVRFTDAFKSDIKQEGAWVGVVQMSDVGFNPKQHWQSEGLNYQYWTKTDVNGNFTIKNIRLGNNYRFYTFQKGVVEEFTAGPFNLIANDPQIVNLSAKITAPNNTFNCEVDRSKGGLVLEVGYPDRDTKEFAFGDKYFTAEIWDKWFQPLFPTNKPAVYNYSPASPKNYKQWPYVHSGWFDPVSRGWSKWDREINFPINGTPTTGATARMTFALAGSDDRQNGDGSWRKNIVVNVNGHTNVATITPGYDDGSFRRAGGHGAYKVMYADIPTRFLRGGNANNNISLSYTYVSQFYSVVYYDYLSLEVPGIRGVITDLEQDSEFNHVYTLSPNPSNTGFISLSVGQESDGMIELKILDVEGKTVHNEILQNASGNTQTIDVSSLNPGLYFLNVKDSKGSKTMKFINE